MKINIGILLLVFGLTLTTSAQWTQSGSNIFYSNAGNVGIGTSSPSSKLHLNGLNVTFRMHKSIFTGTETSSKGLIQIQPDLLDQGLFSFFSLDRFGDTSVDAIFQLTHPIGNSTSWNIMESWRGAGLFISSSGTGLKPLLFGIDRVEKARIASNGNFGIGTETPAYKLDVNGSINATSLFVNGIPVSGGTGSSEQLNFVVTPGNGNGIRFWGSDTWKIHMGNSSEYQYGPVTDYSIKSNMDGTSGRGWTWGLSGVAPIAALSNVGNMKIAGSFESVGPATGNGPTIRASGGGDVVLNSGGSVFFDGNYNYGSGNYIRPVAVNTQAFFTSGVERLRLTPTGTIGIGTLTPNASYKLDVNGPINASAIFINGAPLSGGSQWVTTSSNIYFSTGNVGIGTTSPDAKLAVKGTIHAQEIKVDLTVPGPDYVFNNDYQLPSLEQIKAFIDKNKHLPEVPSAKEMEANGVNLGVMNMLLLKKIEELTLHILQQEERIKALENGKK